VDQALARNVRRFLRRKGTPRVLAIADRPGWAVDNKTQNLQRALRGRYDIVERFQADVTEKDIRSADLVLIFYWLELLKMQVPETVLAARRDRLVMGICSHSELDGDWRERGIAALHRLPRAVFVNSRRLERDFGPLMNVPVHYTPNGVDTSFFAPAREPRERSRAELRLGWAGSLANHGSKIRRFHEVIEPAVAAVSGARLVTAIREEHWRGPDEMLEFYRGLDVYVCASVSEGTPNPCLEAAACGVPIVTTPVGNMPELIEDGVNGFLFDGSVPELVDRLTRLRDDLGLAASMSARIRESIGGWDWTVQAENYARMFDSVL
jgi:glycosyltransferase involved in cell wall biosynthesis